MGKVVDIQPWQGRSPNRTPERRRIGRDLLAVIIVGIGLGLSFAWLELDASKINVLFKSASANLQAFALGSSASTSVEDDDFRVSSIRNLPSIDEVPGKKAGGNYYPVCGGDWAARDNCVVDGDTFHYRGTTIRISDIDAPETHPSRCTYEARLGARATIRLSELLSGGRLTMVRENRDLDKYGRKLRVVIRDGRSIGKRLVSEGLARPWTGKRRPWCGNKNSFG